MANTTSDTSLIVYILIIVYTTSSWCFLNGLYVELPVMVEYLPEGWDFPAYFNISMQSANISCIVYMLVQKFAPHLIKERIAVAVLIFFSASNCFIFSFIWDISVVVRGVERSLPLLILTFVQASSDCISTVVYLPYVSRFKPQYVTGFFIGEGLSAMLTGLLGLAQGFGVDAYCQNVTVTEPTYNGNSSLVDPLGIENITAYNEVVIQPPPNFSVDIFLICMCILLVICGVAFLILDCTSIAANERVVPKSADSKEILDTEQKRNGNINNVPPHQLENLIPYNDIQKNGDGENLDASIKSKPGQEAWRYWVLLVILTWVNFLLYGITPSVQSYACLPYSNSVYTLAVRLSSIANPLSCFIGLFYCVRTLKATTILTTIGTINFAYMFALCLWSPDPPLEDTLIGDFLATFTSVAVNAVFSYTRMAIAHQLRVFGHKGLVASGIAINLGSFLGAALSFVLVQYTGWFITEIDSPCDR